MFYLYNKVAVSKNKNQLSKHEETQKKLLPFISTPVIFPDQSEKISSTLLFTRRKLYKT